MRISKRADSWYISFKYDFELCATEKERKTIGVEADTDPMTIFRLPYLTAVCQETLRIYPVAMLTFPRVPTKPVELQGYDLETGTMIVGSMYLTHQREDLYPEPKKFKPE